MNRATILQRLEMDLHGPFQEEEILADRASDVYLTGILWPWESRMDQEEEERLAGASGDDDGSGTATESEDVPLAGQARPCTAGLSFAAKAEDGCPRILVTVSFGTYHANSEHTEKGRKPAAGTIGWERRQHHLTIGPLDCTMPSMVLKLDEPQSSTMVKNETRHTIPAGLQLHLRTAPTTAGRLITVTAINRATPEPDSGKDGIEKVTLFQVRLEVRPLDANTSLIARPPRRAIIDDDDKSAQLLYRTAREFAAGHTCSATWTANAEATLVTSVATTWIPTAIVPAVRAQGHPVFDELATGSTRPLSASWLSTASGRELNDGLLRLVTAYRTWISERTAEASGLDKDLKETAERHLRVCNDVATRMTSGVDFIAGNKNARLAFQLANRAMQLQHEWDPQKSKSGSLTWRPFQLGFVLLAVESVGVRGHADRNLMDLLWFPTGGGKTESYLALIAFLAFYRRLANDVADDGAGVAAMMRYTLRLLTTQQFTRAAAMILACEALRRGRVPGQPKVALGSVPFSIGLWVGGEATPNTYKQAKEALVDSGKASAKQLLQCPACRKSLTFTDRPELSSIHATCPPSGEGEPECILFDKQHPLPVWTVDEDVYRERPTLLLGTVDKFAQVVRKRDVHELFALPGSLPPDLIIQDELHLISGPLGTMVGLYEVIIDRLFTRGQIRPKIIGSTATIRRASEQVSALFNRDTCQFPPSGLDAADSGFAVVDPTAEGRLYVGLTTAGRSAKFSLQAAAATLLQSGARAFATPEQADPYWTLVTYFNSLRELGGALVLMQDDVTDTLSLFATRRNEAARPLTGIEELTSRRSQAEVRDMLDLLARPANEDGALDVVLASNMLSVGIDVPRLGVMLVNGQPKGIAEYIQATSRVGRRHPGIVVALLNHAKARDRSHYETFTTWHQTLYRDVEATSVTPFASRARDRALHATLVALVRHLVPGMLQLPDLEVADPAALEAVIKDIEARAQAVDATETSVRRELEDRLDVWRHRAPSEYWDDWKPKLSLLQSAERAATQRALGRSPGEAWPTLNSMRNVEPSTPFRLAEYLRDRRAKDGGSDAK